MNDNEINGRFVKRKDFLLMVRNVYENRSINYLLALSDALRIIVSRRRDPNAKKIEDYEGVVQL